MRKILLIGLITVSVALLTAFLVVPVLAQQGGEDKPADDSGWQEMHDACASGDWEKMADAAQKYCHGGDAPQGTQVPSGSSGRTGRGTWGGMMGSGGGMMGGGGTMGGGMMGW